MPDPEKKPLSGNLQIELKNERPSPATFSNAMALNTLNESLVFTFGYFDPMVLKPEPDGALKAVAPVFAQVAVPRTSFAPWLVQAMTLISRLPDRDTFGWSEVAQLFASTPAREG
jgi:hypothetical protein